MRVFEELGLLVQRRWHRHDYDERAFPDVACAAMTELPPSSRVSLEELIDHVWAADGLGPQHDQPFGEPPLVVYQTESFYIEVLPWLDGTTAVHQHAFCGAFHVLSGSSLHSRFEFQPERRYSERLFTGTLNLRDVELLDAGHVRPILPGGHFIHALFHLHRPSVSVVVRTRGDTQAGPQLSYSRASGLAWDPFHKPELLEKRLGLLRLLAATQPERLAQRAVDLLARADAFSVVQIVLALAAHLQHPALSELVANAPCAHPELLERALREVRERGREQALTARRARIHEPEHRFFLALLLNVPEREHILRLVAQRMPGVDPQQTVLQWVAQLGRSAGEDGTSHALGVRFDHSALAVFRLMLAGCDEAAVVAELKRQFPSSDIAAQESTIVTLHRKLRDSRLFRPLFSGLWG